MPNFCRQSATLAPDSSSSFPRTLIILDHVPQVVAAGIVGFAHRHGVVGEIDIAVVAEECCESQSKL
jgi:hypothetical protein